VLPAASACLGAVTSAKASVSEPTCAVLTTAEPACSGTSASGTSATNREAQTMFSMHAATWELSRCNCLYGGVKADTCRLCTHQLTIADT